MSKQPACSSWACLQLATIVEKMSLDWSIQHIDPYLGKAVSPFSPPEQPQASASNFIINGSRMPAWAEPLRPSHKALIREAVHGAISARTRGRDDAADARNARAFFQSHRTYFCDVDGVAC